jgi:hypothetical protein
VARVIIVYKVVKDYGSGELVSASIDPPLRRIYWKDGKSVVVPNGFCYKTEKDASARYKYTCMDGYYLLWEAEVDSAEKLTRYFDIGDICDYAEEHGRGAVTRLVKQLVKGENPKVMRDGGYEVYINHFHEDVDVLFCTNIRLVKRIS